MSSNGDLVRRLMLAHRHRDDAAWRMAAQALVTAERRKNHHILANELESILEQEDMATPFPQTKKSLAQLGASPSEVPRDTERGVPLLEISEARRTLEDLVLTAPVRGALARILEENRAADLLGSYGLQSARKILFCGPPGCGKTVAAEVVAQGLYLPLVLVRFDAVVSSYLGETAANLRKVFDFARTRPMVMLFDEFDAIGKSRTAEEEHGELKRVVNSFLQMLDGFRGNALMLAATNHQGLLDSALWRRFDEIVYFDRPDAQAITTLLTRHLRQIGVSPQLSLKTEAAALVGLAHADIERLALDAVKQTILADRTIVEPDVFAVAVARQQERRALTAEMPAAPTRKRRK